MLYHISKLNWVKTFHLLAAGKGFNGIGNGWAVDIVEAGFIVNIVF
jgi:hypothetical protein